MTETRDKAMDDHSPDAVVGRLSNVMHEHWRDRARHQGTTTELVFHGYAEKMASALKPGDRLPGGLLVVHEQTYRLQREASERRSER